MSTKNKNWSRREFMKIARAAGVGAMVAPVGHLAGAGVKADSEAAAPRTVPTRPFGNSGVNISILSLGGTVNFMSNQLLLKQALSRGVTCWDTSRNYIGGNSEKGIGKYFKKFPQDRQKASSAISGQRLYDRAGQAQIGLGKPGDCQHLLPYAQHEAFAGQYLGGRK